MHRCRPRSIDRPEVANRYSTDATGRVRPVVPPLYRPVVSYVPTSCVCATTWPFMAASTCALGGCTSPPGTLASTQWTNVIFGARGSGAALVDFGSRHSSTGRAMPIALAPELRLSRLAATVRSSIPDCLRATMDWTFLTGCTFVECATLRAFLAWRCLDDQNTRRDTRCRKGDPGEPRRRAREGQAMARECAVPDRRKAYGRDRAPARRC